MGNCKPKPEPELPPTKEALELCSKRLKFHLEIKQNKINQQIIHGEKQLVRRIAQDKSQRSRVDQLLLAERIVNGLKYTAVYTLLIEYSISVASFANFICENINNQTKIQPWRHKLYSLIYAAQKIPLNTLQELSKSISYIHNQSLMHQYADPQIKRYLTPHPTPEEINIYFLQMSERNSLTLDKINEAGHTFSPNFTPKDWDQQFTEKSNQYRNSLPKQTLFRNQGHKRENLETNIKARKSMSNPFDKKNPVENVPINKGKQQQHATNEKLDGNDVSPNITDLMKRISSTSRNDQG